MHSRHTTKWSLETISKLKRIRNTSSPNDSKSSFGAIRTSQNIVNRPVVVIVNIISKTCKTYQYLWAKAKVAVMVEVEGTLSCVLSR